MTTNKVTIGSISEGTLRTEDLLEAFADELERLEPTNPLVAEAQNIDPEAEEADELVNDLADALTAHAPPFGYFGSHPGDGADFGFWVAIDSVNEAIYFGTPAVEDSSYVLIDDGAYWAFISDHGNVTLYENEDGKPGKEIWGIV